MVAEVGNYAFPDKVGFRGWVALEKAIAFESLDGQVTVIEKPN